MTEKQEEMWAELAKHQPIADARGYGTQWQCMCGLKTIEAARAAAAAAGASWAVGDAAGASWAAWAAGDAAGASWAVEGGDHAWAARATKYIREANKLGGVL